METVIFEIEFNDGRIFRVFCANRTQKNRVLRTTRKNVKSITEIACGIHTTSEYEYIHDTTKI